MDVLMCACSTALCPCRAANRICRFCKAPTISDGEMLAIASCPFALKFLGCSNFHNGEGQSQSQSQKSELESVSEAEAGQEEGWEQGRHRYDRSFARKC